MPSRTTTKRPAQSGATPATDAEKAALQARIDKADELAGIHKLPQSIDQITEALSEMLSIGTREALLENVIAGAIEHINRRTYARGIGIDEQDVIWKAVDREISHNLQPWKQDVMAEWRRNRRQSPARIEPKHIDDLIRAEVRDALEYNLESFLGKATPKEVRFLADVMSDWNSRSFAAPNDDAEIYIGLAFERQLGRDNCYLRVPERMVDQVEKYVAALRAIDNKAA